MATATPQRLGKWFAWGSMPTPRVYCPAIECEQQFFVVGGCDKMGKPVDAFESAQISSRQWKKLKNMPSKRAAPVLAAVKGHVFVIGGVAPSQHGTEANEKYDISSASWSSVAPMNDQLIGHSSVVKDDLIYVVGGQAVDTNPVGKLSCYDATTNRWLYKTSMPTERYATFSFLLDGRLYVIGGRQGKNPVAALEAYDFNSDKWDKLDPVPTDNGIRVFAAYGLAEQSQMIISAGGLLHPADKGFSAGCEIYDVRAGKWRLGRPMSSARGDCSAAVVAGSHFVVAGGINQTGRALTSSEAYDLGQDQWSPLPDLATSHCSCSTLLVSQSQRAGGGGGGGQQTMFVIGGLAIKGPSKNVEALNVKDVQELDHGTKPVSMDRE